MKKLSLQRQTVRTLTGHAVARVRGGMIAQPGASDECPGTLDPDACGGGGGAPTGRCDLAPSYGGYHC
jgi:hypothetical protein